MPCYRPLKGYRSAQRNPSGKRSIIFSGNPKECYKDQPVTLPCGNCPGCREQHARKWALRITHETQLHEYNSFLTLTYNEGNLPKDGGLHVEDFQKFLKKLRIKIKRSKYNDPVYGLFKTAPSPRYFHCGEYGDKRSRPHYHACLFGFDFLDKSPSGQRDGNIYYSSAELDSLWGHGFATIGNLEYASALYVARYTTKKLRGEQMEYEYIDEETGEILQRKPEYATMSRRPGIGKLYFEKYKNDFFPDDFVLLNGQKQKVPKYYDQLLERESASEYAKVKAKRQVQAERQTENNTWPRLKDREHWFNLRRGFFNKRHYENGT